MSYEIEALRSALVAWLRWHATTANEIERAPAECRPLLDAMSRASETNAVARLALAIQEAPREVAEVRGRTLDEIALAIGFGECPWGQNGVHRPDDLAEAIRQALRERDTEIDRRGAYVDAWDEYFRAAKGSDREGRQLAAISKARDAWECDTAPEGR